MGFVVIVPARMSSSRLKEKPLADICGKPMVVRTAERALGCGADAVFVACDSPAIVKACEEHDIKALLTDPNCPTGTDRLAEAAAALGLTDDTIVVNVQGDEPLIPINVIRAVAEDLEKHDDCAIATAAHPISDAEHFFNPKLAPAPIEKFESLEQLRALWHGYRISVLILDENLPSGVDTAEDLERVRAVYAESLKN